jgi:nucleotidyltransferase/DNA polymerase involved in DNA repair
MDAFFASVEELDHPEWRGRPVIVGADPKGGRGRGVVAACNYVARRFGIHSAMPISQAWRRCPQGIFAPPRGARYSELSHRIFDIFCDFTDLVEPLSIDEAFLDVTGSARLLGDAAKIGREIKRRIREELGLVASVGIAPNKFVAKIASDVKKPDGFVVVRPEEVEAFLRDLPITRLWGVGEKTAETLRRRGIQTIGDMARLRPEDAVALLGDHGLHLNLLARGIDDRPVETEHTVKSIGAEYTFDEDTNEEEAIRATLLRLSDKVAARLRKAGLWAGGVSLKFRDETFKTLTRSMTLERPVAVTDAIFEAALELLGRTGWKKGGKRVRLLGVAAYRLGEEDKAVHPQQLGLFEPVASEQDERPAEKSFKAETAVDELRKRFGRDAVKRGTLLPKKSS